MRCLGTLREAMTSGVVRAVYLGLAVAAAPLAASAQTTTNDAAGWRAWVFSTVPEQRHDFAAPPMERSTTLGAFLTYPVTGTIDAGLRLDRTTDVLGEPQGRSALLVVRVPLFGSPAPQEPRAQAFADPRVFSPRPAVEARANTNNREEGGLLARLLDPKTYAQALRLDVPLRWVFGAPESSSGVSLPPLQPPAASAPRH